MGSAQKSLFQWKETNCSCTHRRWPSKHKGERKTEAAEVNTHITSLIELKYIQNVVRYYFRNADTVGKILREIKGSKLWLSLEPRASPCGSNGKELARSTGDTRDVSSIPGSGKFPGEGNGNPLQYSCLRNPMDRGAWQATVHGVAKSWTQLTEHACIGVNSSTREEPGPVLSRNVRSCRAHKGQKLGTRPCPPTKGPLSCSKGTEWDSI